MGPLRRAERTGVVLLDDPPPTKMPSHDTGTGDSAARKPSLSPSRVSTPLRIRTDMPRSAHVPQSQQQRLELELELPSHKATNGFIALCGTYAAGLLVLVWAVLPCPLLVDLGLGWLPAQEWTIIVPAWSISLVMLAYWTYAALMARATPGMHDLRLLTDHKAQVPPTREARRDDEDSAEAATRTARKGPPEPYDISIGAINRMLYPPRARPKR